MKYYVVCNWKMSPTVFVKAKGLLSSYNKFAEKSKKERTRNMAELVVCPPFLYMQMVKDTRSRAIGLGAQDVFWNGKGPYTGKVSAKMLAEFGAEFVIVGHNELRHLGDSDKMVIAKIREILKMDMKPIVCIGYRNYLKEAKIVISNFSADEVNKMIFAYDPVEAVGSNKPISPERVGHAIRSIKGLIFRRFRKKYLLGMVGLGGSSSQVPKPPIIYGGDITGENFKNYLAISELSGFIIGRESMKPESIEKIVKQIESC